MAGPAPTPNPFAPKPPGAPPGTQPGQAHTSGRAAMPVPGTGLDFGATMELLEQTYPQYQLTLELFTLLGVLISPTVPPLPPAG